MAVVPRPIRPVHEWRPGRSAAQRPASTTRRSTSYPSEDIAVHTARIASIPPAER